MSIARENAFFGLLLVVIGATGYFVARDRDGRATRVRVDQALFETAESAVDSSERTIGIVIFTDYQCEYCAAFESAIDSLPPELRSRVTRFVRHFPLARSHPQAFEAATAVECASSQGKRAQAHAWMYSHGDNVALRQWSAMAREITSLDTIQLNSCMADSAARAVVRRDIRQAQQIGIRSTPSFLLGGELTSGAIGSTSLEQRVRETLRRPPPPEAH